MIGYGEYLVTGRREYRGHEPGTTFTARLDVPAAQRAINRGDIRFLRHIIPSIEPGSYQLPDGWLPSPHTTTTEAPEGASLIERGK